MVQYQPPKNWSSAILAALALGCIATFAVAAVCVVFSSFTAATAFSYGGLVGFALAAFMLWLFFWRQITAKDIWQSIGALWHEFGKN
jgi:hypothetical protein